MNLKNIFKRNKQTKEQQKQARMRGNKSNMFTSLIVATVAIGTITMALKPDSVHNDNALMIEAINNNMNEIKQERERERYNAARRDYYINSLKEKGLNKHEIKLQINTLSDQQRKNKGFPVETKKVDYSKEILKLKEKQEREKEIETNLNVRVNKKRKLSYS